MRVAIDSVVFIYASQDTHKLGDSARDLLNRIANSELNGVASTLCLAEVLVKPLELSAEAGRIMQLEMEGLPHLDYVSVNEEIAIRSALLRSQHGPKLRLADGIHLATALEEKADIFVTNDHKLAGLKIAGLQIKLLGEPF
jgi:predicted nucleic acid-binding protein